MPSRKKKNFTLKKTPIKIYLPFANNTISIKYIDEEAISAIDITQDYLNIIIPSKHQLKPISVNADFEQVLVDNIALLKTSNGGLTTNNLLKIFILENKLIDHFPTMINITNLITTIEMLEEENRVKPILNMDQLPRLSNTLRELKSMITFNQKNIKNVEDELTRNNEPIIYTNPKSSDRMELTEYILPNRKTFQNFINTKLIDESTDHTRSAIKKWNIDTKSYIDIFPFSHQNFVSNYLSDKTPYRGLLLYHGLGSGKSGASILIGEGFINRRVVILLPASIRNNYVGEIRTFGEIAYKDNFHWTFIKLPHKNVEIERKYIDIMAEKGINNQLYRDLIKNTRTNELGTKERGIWMIDYTKQVPNFDTLSLEDVKSLKKQITILFEYKYTICHYNSGQYTITKILESLVPEYNAIYVKLFGSRKISSLKNKDRDKLLNYIYNKKNNIENPFSNKVLIIDEIHNLTSSMAGSSYNAPRLYELIMRAENLKLVFLSGTPVINYPYELAIMFNMLRGFIAVYTITLNKDSGLFNKDEINTILSGAILIDRYEIKRKTIKLIRNPNGFINKFDANGSYMGVVKDQTNDITNIEFVDYLRKLFRKNNYTFSIPNVSHSTVFPDVLDKRTYNTSVMLGNAKYLELQQAIFNETYISSEGDSVENSLNFMNRIIGSVSFYNEISSKDDEEDIFPEKKVADDSENEIYMSNYQFIEYGSKRRIERELESVMKKRSATKEIDVNEKIPNLFKVFSRQKGIFVFPPNITRPKPPRKNSKSAQTINDEYSTINDELQLIVANSSKETVYTSIEAYILGLEDDKRKVAMDIFNKSFKNVSENIYDYKDYLESLNFGGDGDVFEQCDDMEEEEKYSVRCNKAINSLSDTNLTVNDDAFSLATLSPKYVKILENINLTPGLVFMYSQFRSVEGIEIFARVLVKNGYTRITIKDGEASSEDVVEVGKMVRYLNDSDGAVNQVCGTYIITDVDGLDIHISLADDYSDERVVTIDEIALCKFSLWTGSENPTDRNTILNLYNSLDNMWGYKCLILLTTQSGAEGISLKFVRQVHIMEPYWNNVRIDQVVGRARRIKSHMELPLKDRNVTIYNYIIKYTIEQLNGSWVDSLDVTTIEKVKSGEENGFDEEDYEEEDDIVKSFSSFGRDLSDEITMLDDSKTSDELLVDISIRKEHILNQFLDLMKKVSVDCVFNRLDNIRSNNELEDLTCYPIDTSFNLSDGSYMYEITTEDIVADNSSVSNQQDKIVQYKRLTVPFTVSLGKNSSYTLKFILILPENIDTYANTPDNTPVYDYYIYHGLNLSKLNLEGQLIPIGVIKNITGPTPEFNPRFINSLDLYKKIEEYISEINTSTGFIQDMLTIKQGLVEQNKRIKYWTCIACTTEYPDSVAECVKDTCIGITKEMSIEYSKSVKSSESKTSKSSKTSSGSSKSLKVKKRRRRKKKVVE